MSEQNKSGSVSRTWLIVAGVAVAALLWFAYKAFVSQGFDWKQFFQSFARMDLGWLGISVALSFLTYVGRAFRWALLIKPQKPKPSLWNLFSATAIGFTAIVLFGRPGEMVRPYVIGLKEKLSFSSQMAAWLLERIYDLMMALFIFGFALSHVRGSGVQVGERLNWVLEAGGYFVGVIGFACLAVFVALRQFGERSEHRIVEAAAILPEHYRTWLTSAISAFRHGVESTKSWSAVVGVLGYSLLEWVLIVGCTFAMLRAVPATNGFSLTDTLILLGFVAFGNVVQIPGVGGGMQIVMVLVLTELFGVSLEASTSVALLGWLITFVVIVPFGLGLAFHDGLQWRKLRHIGDNQPE